MYRMVARGGAFLNTVNAVLILLVSLSAQSRGEGQCGKIISRPRKHGKLTGKIIGGYEVGYYKYPWFAALQNEGDTLCGGTLIGPNFVLTAAHCFDMFINHGHKPEDVYTVKLGIYQQCKDESTQTAYSTVKVDIHEKYKDNKPYYDIALLQLSGDTSKYSPICLPTKVLLDTDKDREGKIIGFGSMIDENGRNVYPCEMREARVLNYDNATCIDMVKQHTTIATEYAFTNAFCAGYKAGGVDSCAGDSGGPLMTIDEDTNTWKTIGITSFGWGCGEKNAMGVYTDVSKYLDWIKEKSGIVSSEPNLQLDPQSTLHSIHSGNKFVDAIIGIYDRIMNTTDRPKEIVIHFKNKPL